MLNNQTLRSLKLIGMTSGLEQQVSQPSTREELGFEERLGCWLSVKPATGTTTK